MGTMKRWYLLKADPAQFAAPQIVAVFDRRPFVRAWFLTKWSKISGRPFRYFTELRTERRRNPYAPVHP